jgi:DNA-binding NtrC family response regulator
MSEQIREEHSGPDGTPTQVTRVVQRAGGTVRLLRGAAVEVLRGPDAGTRVEIDRARFVIGSHAHNDLVLRDPTVSRHHLEVTATPDGYRVVDLGSSNGTFAAGLRLGEALVAGAVVLQLGSTTLRLSPGTVEQEVPAWPEHRFGPLVGRSLPMRELFAQLERVAQSDCSVLIEGETGVGKEKVAEAIHAASPLAGGPFVVVDCGALAPGLMESELFGHARGAFTGAVAERRGLIELADGGTLFLDEIGELPMPLQVKLLGALERRRVTPVGSHESRPVRARVIAATHRDLLRRVNQGQFRAELYYRLAVVRLRVPPLRERLEDLPLLVESCLGQLRARDGDRVPPTLSALALAHLYAQPWPGNVRELFNAVEQAALQLPQSSPSRDAPAVPPYLTTREQALDDFNRSYFSSLVQRSSNVSQLAREAGLDRRYLLRILERYGITRPNKRVR